MKYFFPTVVEDKPYIKMDCIAKSTDELNMIIDYNKTFDNDLLVLEKDVSKMFMYDICLFEIKNVNGKNVFVNRNQEQVKQAKAEYELKQKQARDRNIDKQIQSVIRFFEYDNCKFSLSQNAQLNWNRLGLLFYMNKLDKDRYSELSTYDSKTYMLKNKDIPDFVEACDKQINMILSKARLAKKDDTI